MFTKEKLPILYRIKLKYIVGAKTGANRMLKWTAINERAFFTYGLMVYSPAKAGQIKPYLMKNYEAHNHPVTGTNEQHPILATTDTDADTGAGDRVFGRLVHHEKQIAMQSISNNNHFSYLTF